MVTVQRWEGIEKRMQRRRIPAYKFSGENCTLAAKSAETWKQFLAPQNNIYTSVKNGPNTGYVCATCLCAFAYRRGHVQGEWVRGAQMRGGGRGATPLTAPQFAVCGVYVLPVCDMYCCLQWCFSPNKLAT